MRLGQLARKLGLSPNAVVEHLNAKGVQVDQDANTRVSDDAVRFVVAHFAPARLEEFFKVAKQPEQVEQPTPEVIAEPVNEIEELVVPEVEAISDASDPVADPTEVIRAPKVELQGLKVVGKIELPQPKKKAESEQPATEGEQHQPTQEFRGQRKPSPYQQREQRPWKNPLEQKRKREEAEAEKKRQQAAEDAKAKRTQNYLKRVKSVPTKAVRRLEEEVVVESEVDTAPPPKTVWGKFVRWLTT